ncbi:MAG: hypothetical protein C0408_00120 [Odoribacter sp.]|nr:hypothetical protein [Odoribacter sp.]
MKLHSVKLLSFLLLAFSLNGCQKDYIVSDKQDILFMQEYINYAWGYQHSGFIIESNGNVLSFNNPDKWNFPDKDNKLTKEKIQENILSCTLTGKVIPGAELQKYVNHIDNISSSKISSMKNVGADMGSLVYYCYQFSENSSTYKATRIKMEGDFECENLNFFSKKVVVWMKSISTSISR